MTEQISTEPAPTVTATAGGISMTIDLHQMLTAIDPAGRWVGYDPDEDDDRYEPSSLALQIADLTADRLTKLMRVQVRSMIEDQVGTVIAAQVTEIVRAFIQGEQVQLTDEFGSPQGAPLPLTQMIVKAAEALNKKPYHRDPSPMEKMVREVVGTAFKNELQQAVNDARSAALAAVRDSAADVIQESIKRAARGMP